MSKLRKKVRPVRNVAFACLSWQTRKTVAHADKTKKKKKKKKKEKGKKMEACTGGESNPGLPRGRRD